MEVSKQPKLGLLEQIKKRFGTIERVLLIAIATILDPRFLNIHFRNRLALSEAVQAIIRLMKNTESSNVSTSSKVKCEEMSEPGSFWRYHATLVQQKQLNHDHAGHDATKDELAMYLSNQLAPLKSDPLEEWKKLLLSYPVLFKIAMKYLPVVATSVPSERLFSKAGATVCQERNRLLGKRITKLVFFGSVPEDDWL